MNAGVFEGPIRASICFLLFIDDLTPAVIPFHLFVNGVTFLCSISYSTARQATDNIVLSASAASDA